MHLPNCRCFQEHLMILLQSLKALCKDPADPGGIWKYLEVLVRVTAVSGRFAYGFRTNLNFADGEQHLPGYVSWENIPVTSGWRFSWESEQSIAVALSTKVCDVWGSKIVWWLAGTSCYWQWRKLYGNLCKELSSTWTMTSDYGQCSKGNNYEIPTPQPESIAQRLILNPSDCYVQFLDVLYLLIILEWCYSLVLTVYIFRVIHHHKSNGGVTNRINSNSFLGVQIDC